MSFTPSPLQAQAISAIKDWFQNRAKEQQVFRVFGYAGTGKTTITKHAIADLGLSNRARTAQSERRRLRLRGA
jgi:exodeoxyribonuclease-5